MQRKWLEGTSCMMRRLREGTSDRNRPASVLVSREGHSGGNTLCPARLWKVHRVQFLLPAAVNEKHRFPFSVRRGSPNPWDDSLLILTHFQSFMCLPGLLWSSPAWANHPSKFGLQKNRIFIPCKHEGILQIRSTLSSEMGPNRGGWGGAKGVCDITKCCISSTWLF